MPYLPPFSKQCNVVENCTVVGFIFLRSIIFDISDWWAQKSSACSPISDSLLYASRSRNLVARCDMLASRLANSLRFTRRKLECCGAISLLRQFISLRSKKRHAQYFPVKACLYFFNSTVREKRLRFVQLATPKLAQDYSWKSAPFAEMPEPSWPIAASHVAFLLHWLRSQSWSPLEVLRCFPFPRLLLTNVHHRFSRESWF